MRAAASPEPAQVKCVDGRVDGLVMELRATNLLLTVVQKDVAVSNRRIDAARDEVRQRLEGLDAVAASVKELGVHLDVRIDKLETGMNARIDKLETGMNARIDKLETGMNARIDKLETGMNARMDKMDARMDKTDARIDKLDGRMEKLESSMSAVVSRLDRMDNGQTLLQGQLLLFQASTSAQLKVLQDTTAAQLQVFKETTVWKVESSAFRTQLLVTVLVVLEVIVTHPDKVQALLDVLRTKAM